MLGCYEKLHFVYRRLAGARGTPLVFMNVHLHCTDDSNYLHISATTLTVAKWHPFVKWSISFSGHNSNNGNIKMRNFALVIIICNMLVD